MDWRLVWTRDYLQGLSRGKGAARRHVWVNHMQPTYVRSAVGRYKAVRLWARLGPWGLEEYLEQTGFRELDETPIGWYWKCYIQISTEIPGPAFAGVDGQREAGFLAAQTTARPIFMASAEGAASRTWTATAISILPAESAVSTSATGRRCHIGIGASARETPAPVLCSDSV